MRFITCAVALFGIALAALSLRAEEAGGSVPESVAIDPSLDALLGDEELAPMINEALKCREAGADDDAIKHLRRVNAAIKKRHGANALQQLPILDLAAEILFVAGRYAEAITPLERAVTIRGSQAGDGDAERDVALASSLLLLGRAQAENGNKAGAAAALTRAVQLFAASLGDEHEATLAARRSLAAVSPEKEAS